MSETWTVVTYDLFTMEPYGEIPFNQEWEFTNLLNDAGDFSGKIDLPLAARTAPGGLIDIKAATQVNNTLLCVYRDGVPLWLGQIKTQKYNQSSREANIGAKSILGYFDNIAMAKDYTSTEYPLGVRTDELIWQVYTDAMAFSPANQIGLVMPSKPDSAPYVVPQYPQSQWSYVSQVLSDMTSASQATGGAAVEVHDARVAMVDGSPVAYFTIGYPRLGRLVKDSGLIVDLLAASTLDYDWPADGTLQASRVIELGGTLSSAVGSTTTTGQVFAKATNTNQLGRPGESGYPWSDQVISRSQVVDGDYLQAIANGDLDISLVPPVSPVVTVATDAADPEFGSWEVGDDLLVVSDPDYWFPEGLREEWRIISQTITVPAEGPAKAALTLDLPPEVL